jgi:hypothetical protein
VDLVYEGYPMNTADQIMKEVRRLPERLAREVLDFIGYIELKHGLKDRLTEGLMEAQEPAMKHVWDNPEDEVWNDL